jgi:catechol 2,3-dioxygenase
MESRQEEKNLDVKASAKFGERTQFRMPAEARLGGLALRVRDLESVHGFYTDSLGFQVLSRGSARIELGLEKRGVGLELLHDPQAPTRSGPSIGLYHFALLVPDRPALGAIVKRLTEKQWPFDGASDHGVSEAFYLRDPEGNGIELYRDRPPDTWHYRDGYVDMFTQPLDVTGLLEETATSAPLHPATRLGHVHLHVDDLEAGERFYSTVLGLNVTQRSYPGALFLAAGRYHHHVGLNTWARGRRSPQNATGLVRYSWVVPRGTVHAFIEHLQAQGISYEGLDSAVALVDPIGIRLEVRDT